MRIAGAQQDAELRAPQVRALSRAPSRVAESASCSVRDRRGTCVFPRKAFSVVVGRCGQVLAIKARSRRLAK